MNLTIPICVRQLKLADRDVVVHHCYPLFDAEQHWVAKGIDLGKAISRLADAIRKHLAADARSLDQATIARWDYSAPIESHNLNLHLVLNDRSLHTKLLLVVLRRYGYVCAFSPLIPEVWFDIGSSEQLEARAIDVYTHFFTQCVKSGRETQLELASSYDTAWIDALTISVDTQVNVKKEVDPFLAMLGGSSVGDGASELSVVGRCLNWVDLDSLADPIGLDELIDKIVYRMTSGDRRGVVLVGPSGSGKTAAIEGAARRRRLTSDKAEQKESQIWQLSPGRLISGMSYLGQWQSRVLAIWKHAHLRDHVLYLDDMLGLYHAGVTRDSKTCVADLIRAQVEVAPVRLVTEMTPEAWAIFRERDRALAQSFVVLPMEGKSRQDSLPILLGIVSRLEAAHRCRFDHDVLPELLGLYDRFERTSVLPGKAISAMQRLALTHAKESICRRHAQAEFMGRTGLSQLVVDPAAQLTRQRITDALGEHVVGQTEPINRLTDRILASAARINDTSRPIGVFLLLGPTGVGKTELAKTVAKYLFGDDGLVRIDMNELATGDAAARLVGTFDSPDGILTSAARRRPHAVLLLDEIEKASPDVLDTLLQVIGEARLTDARGRTVDLSGMLILMTSNLGASHSDRSTVMNEASASRSAIYRRAAKDFFRPEFFNRIDGLLDFEPLDLEVVAEIAQRQMEVVLSRDGLARRMMVVEIESNALREVVGRGFDSRLGARAVRRQVERELVTPIARVLVECAASDLLLIHATASNSSLDLTVKPIKLLNAEIVKATEPSPETVLSHAEMTLSAATLMLPKRHFSVSTDGGKIDPKLLQQLALQEQMEDCREAIRRLEDCLDSTGHARTIAIGAPPSRTQMLIRHDVMPRSFLMELQAANDLSHYLRDITETLPITVLQSAARDVRRELYRLSILTTGMHAIQPLRFSVRIFGERKRSISHTITDTFAKIGGLVPPPFFSLRSTLLRAAMELTGENSLESVLPGADKDLPESLIVDDPDAIGILTAMVGGWLRIDDKRRASYAEASLEPVNVGCADVNPPKPMANYDPATVRWMLIGDQGIDLKTGQILRDAKPISLIRQLILGNAPPLVDL